MCSLKERRLEELTLTTRTAINPHPARSALYLPAHPFVLSGLCVPSSVLDGFTSIASNDPMAKGLRHVDVGIANGVFCSPQDIPNAARIVASGWSALPRFVDAHVHLDKSLSVTETGLSDGTLLGAIQLYSKAASTWDQSHFERRMEMSVLDAVTAGTGAMRSHIDCFGTLKGATNWDAAQAIQARFKDIIEIQLCPLTSIMRAGQPNFEQFCREIELSGNRVIGAFVPPGFSDQPLMEQFLRYADTFGFDVDFHIDENLIDTAASIEILADAVLSTKFSGRVLAGHVCALLNAAPDDLDRILDKIAAANITIATLPRTNLYLQSRAPSTTPRKRGITPIHEMRARQIPVIFGTDNVADTFFPFGDYDMLGLFRDSAVYAHLDQDLSGWLTGITRTPAQALGVASNGAISVGAPADAVLIPASNWSELLARDTTARTILTGGVKFDLENTMSQYET